jgi:DNA polymerase I-like protein with 3'-5' exonuclease and polymerase domains
MERIINTPSGEIKFVFKPEVNITESCKDDTIFVLEYSKNNYVYFPYHKTVVRFNSIKVKKNNLCIAGYRIKELIKKFLLNNTDCYDIYIAEKYIETDNNVNELYYSLEEILNRYTPVIPHEVDDDHVAVLQLCRMPYVVLRQVNFINSSYNKVCNLLTPWTTTVYDPQTKKQIKIAIKTIPLSVELNLIKYLIGVENNGMAVDTEMLYKMYHEMQERFTKERDYFFSAGINPFDPRITRKLNDSLLIERITKFRCYKANYDKLKDLIKYYKDGRVLTHLEQIGGVTYTIISSRANLQNIDSRLRNIFTVSDGKLLISADFSQIEARIAAVLYNDKRMIEMFNKGIDIHTNTASEILGIPYNGINSEIRKKAKAINFGLMYGMSAKRLVDYCKDQYGIILDRKESLSIRSKFLQYYRGIKSHIDYTAGCIKRYGYVTTRTLSGRKIITNTLTTSLNYPVQASRGEIVKLAIVLFLDALKHKGITDASVVNIVHDEIIVESDSGIANEVEGILKESMTVAAISLLKDVPVEVKIKKGNKWQ